MIFHIDENNKYWLAFIGVVLALMVIGAFMTGCSYNGWVKKTKDGYEWSANHKCKLETPDGFKMDAEGEPLVAIGLPDISAAKLGL